LGGTSARLDWPIQEMPNLLNLHHEPESATDRSHEMFFDQGAWHGYALPPNNDTGTGFVGPFLGATDGGLWAGSRFATVALNNSVSKNPIPLYACDSGGVSLPGALTRQACGGGIVVTETLFYPSASTTLVRVTITSSQAKSVQLTVGGNQSGPVLSKATLQVKLLGSDAQAIHGEDGRYSFTLPHEVQLAPSHPAIFYLQQSYFPDTSGAKLSPWNGSPESAWKEASKRWKLYLVKSRNLQPELAGREDVRRINVKAIITLLGNWRVPLGDMQYAGLFPSYSNPDFNAFWSWDSWKHAAALATFAPDLAKDQVRAIFAFQEPNGMIPDKVSRNRAENNLRDTKPPLAAWAVAKIYEQTHDRQFVGEMFDRLYRYHRWWYTDRDHDHNGLAEYGSTDGTIEAARWESGMDNAVRFDGAAMLQNGQGAWSLDQESVDLNCYLYQDKLELADMAALLGKAALAKQLREEASTLRTRIQRVFFDPPSGYFFDKRLGQESLIRVFGPEGWIPLWTGVASEEQAKDVAKVLRDPAKFNTIFPFPTLAKDDPRFTAGTGYWRGPVWIDQAVFALQGMIRYGMARDADEMRTKLLTNSPGLAGVEPFRETYNPDTGEGQNSRNFGWSAAEYFLLIH
jgi:putative isomerase